MVWMIVAMIGEREVSFLGLFTTLITAGFMELFMSRGISSELRAMNNFLVLIFLKALERVLLTPAVCRSESTPLTKASAMAAEVRSTFKKLIRSFVSNCWYRA